ncbi:DUF6313 family protein [Streptomyces sp. A1136]|uniref:DUF6313 family protein n=1 Tax=Streptomyces sp. A1136 TaxID=2563102 RepID=UPI00109E56F9|nr:DUF6313 family protein [Streptomyces sp. A1136]THA47500.1 hypothetical protein E6R62_31305 [Streptomyces sp. A1136]
MEADEPTWPPPGSNRRRHKMAKWFYRWWKRPLFIWFRQRGVWGFLLVTVLYLAASWSLHSFECAAQFMIGYLNPFDPPQPLRPGQKAWAITIRFVGWILIPAVVGSAAGLVVAEQMRRAFNKDPRRLRKGLVWRIFHEELGRAHRE